MSALSAIESHETTNPLPHGAHGTGNNEWYTPAEYIDAARDVLGVINLDPASNPIAQATVKADAYFTKDTNGLEQDWHGNVWLNPPYSRPLLGLFVDKLVAEYNAGNVGEAIMLTHNYTDTAWFKKAREAASAICFPEGRIRFISPDNGKLASPTQGQTFFYFGKDPSRFLARFGGYGFAVPTRAANDNKPADKTPLTLDDVKDKIGGVINTGDFGFVGTPVLDTHADLGARGSYSIHVSLSEDAQDGIKVTGHKGREEEAENYVREALGLPKYVLPVPAITTDKKPAAENQDRPLTVIDPTEWQDKPIQPQEWFVENMIPAGVPTLFSGDGGTGKSQLALQLMASSSLQLPWLGLPVADGPCLYYGAEDSENELHRRMARIVAHHGRNLSDLKGIRLVSMAEHDAVLAEPDRSGNLQVTKTFEKLIKLAADFAPKLIVIDTSADAFGGDEIKRVQVRKFITMLRQMGTAVDAAILLLSHPSLAGMASGTGLSGSTAWNNSVRSRLYLRPEKEEHGRSISPVRKLSVEKSNYAVAGDELSLRWKDGVYVLDGGEDPAIGNLLNGNAEGVYLRLLTKLCEQGQDLSPNRSSTYAPTVMARHPDAKGHNKKALESAQQRLLDAKRICIVTEGSPSKRRKRIVLAPTA